MCWIIRYVIIDEDKKYFHSVVSMSDLLDVYFSAFNNSRMVFQSIMYDF